VGTQSQVPHVRERKRVSTYAIGDLQGCFETLQKLLGRIDFRPGQDRLWFVGDLVNRGAGSLACLRFVRDQGAHAVTVLGNHDLHLLAVAEGFAKLRAHDTLDEILAAPDRDALLHWLRQQKLLHFEDDFALVHAGIHPAWSWSRAAALANDVETALRGADYRGLLQNMYGNEPDHWNDALVGTPRLRFAINVFTRMRALTRDDGLDMKFKGEYADLPHDRRAWFDAPTSRTPKRTVIAGHWSALGVRESANFIGLDAGCVWGRELAALRLEDRKVFRVPCAEQHIPDGWD
jgi:bis(5'-nucleosyl)-tetraphosphatase (symmetrical)